MKLLAVAWDCLKLFWDILFGKPPGGADMDGER